METPEGCRTDKRRGAAFGVLPQLADGDARRRRPFQTQPNNETFYALEAIGDQETQRRRPTDVVFADGNWGDSTTQLPPAADNPDNDSDTSGADQDRLRLDRTLRFPTTAVDLWVVQLSTADSIAYYCMSGFQSCYTMGPHNTHADACERATRPGNTDPIGSVPDMGRLTATAVFPTTPFLQRQTVTARAARCGAPPSAPQNRKKRVAPDGYAGGTQSGSAGSLP